MRKILFLLAFVSTLAHAQYYGGYLPKSGGTITGNLGVTGNVNVQGNISSTLNTLPAGTTNSGVALSAAPNVADVIFFDSTQTANNRTAEWLFFQGKMQARFKNDAGDTALPALAITGGQAGGITGITSDSGSGSWIHTGNFGTTGQQSVLPVGGNGIVVAGTNSVGVPSITTFGAANNISLNIATKGAGGINLLSTTAVTGSLTATGNITATGTGTMPVYGNTGTAFNAQHMVTGYVTLAAGAATVTLSGAAVFTNATTYTCTANDTTTAAAVKVTPSSGTSIVFAGTTTDVLAYQCVGN